MPCPYCLAPCPIIQRPDRILKKVFRQGCKNACKMLADLCPCFHRSPTKLCPDLVSFMCWIGPNFGHSRSKLCPIICRSRNKLCPNFGCSRARLCPISFAPCPFPSLAGTLNTNYTCNASIEDRDRTQFWYRIVSKTHGIYFVAK